MPAKKKQVSTNAVKKTASTPKHTPDYELVLTKTMGGSIAEHPVELPIIQSESGEVQFYDKRSQPFIVC